MAEPRYVNPDDPWGDQPRLGQRAKWQHPNSSWPWEKKILDAVDRKYYQNHNEKSTVVRIARAVKPLQTIDAAHIPEEYVAFCCNQAIYNRKVRHIPVQLSWLIRWIMDKERMKVWMETRPELRKGEDKERFKMFNADEEGE